MEDEKLLGGELDMEQDEEIEDDDADSSFNMANNLASGYYKE
jgi:hypothetical protein